MVESVLNFTKKSEGVYNGIERATPPSTCQTFSITRDSMACQCQTFDNSVKHLTPGCCRCATCVTFVQHVCVSLYLFFATLIICETIFNTIKLSFQSFQSLIIFIYSFCILWVAIHLPYAII